MKNAMFTHFGLTFTDTHVQQARKARDRKPFQSAWTFLHEHTPGGALASMQWNALRYRFNDEMEAGGLVVEALNQTPFAEEATGLDGLKATIVLVQCFEMARDHSGWLASGQRRWLDGLLQQVNHWNGLLTEAGYIETVWTGVLNLWAGIALEREDVFQAGVEVYQQVVRDDVRPAGHIPKAVGDTPRAGDGQGLYRQIMVVAALVLMAEAAAHVGVDLWSYASRGVSVMTAATYLVYYYYYPEQWQWDAKLQDAEARALFREHGGFLELLNHHTPPKGIKQPLDDLRPIYDVYGGGLTTLTHGVIVRRGLFR